MNLKDFTSFDKMITPTIVKILFYIGVFLTIVCGLVEIIGGLASGEGSLVFFGFITVIFGPIFAKVYCELLMVIFKIYDTLKEINQKMK